MPLVTLKNITLSYGQPPLLDGIHLVIENNERICLLGRNGAGKSTLLRLLNGEIAADQGELICQDGVRIAMLEQTVPEGVNQRVFEVVAAGLGALGKQLSDYHDAALALAKTPHDVSAMQRLERLQQQLEASDGWSLEQRVETVISRLALPIDADFATLSGGLKRRVLLARALLSDPDLLLLDEPTNHLDIESIDWLENFLLGFNASLLFITHDRTFLRHLATRIIELDRGRLYDWPGDYDNYLQLKAQAMEAEKRQHAEFDKKLAQEEAWIRQGIEARRTRNEGRVRALKSLREARANRRNATGTARIQIQQANASGRLVIEATQLCFTYNAHPIIQDFSTLILRGDKIGIIGPNGVGKSTLIRLLTGQLSPTQGKLRHGTNLHIAYFDQHRASLDEKASVADNVGLGRDMLTINEKPRHVLSYLQDFLFSPARARQPVKALSGGERGRLLLAKLFSQPANLLILDEPTNDLDAETLELLEERIIEFTGTVLVISHDRAFLDNIASSTLVFEGEGRVQEYVGGYQDWLRQRPQPTVESMETKSPQTRAAKPTNADKHADIARPKKLGYKAQRELDALPQQIEALETEQAKLLQQISDPAFYQQPDQIISATQQRLSELEQELNRCYARWETLESNV